MPYFYLTGDDHPLLVGSFSHPAIFDTEDDAWKAAEGLVETGVNPSTLKVLECACDKCTGYSSMKLAGIKGWCGVRGTRPIGPDKTWNCFHPR